MALRIWMLTAVVLAVTTSSTSHGLSQFEPNGYDVLGLELFRGEADDVNKSAQAQFQRLSQNQNTTAAAVKLRTETGNLIHYYQQLFTDPVKRFEYDTQLLEFLLDKPNIYFAFNLRPYEGPDALKNNVSDVRTALTNRLKNPPAGASATIIARAQKVSEEARSRLGDLWDEKKREKVEKAIMRQHPYKSNMKWPEYLGWEGVDLVNGTIGFMAGNWAYLQMKCYVLGDPNMCWQAADQLDDVNTRWGLVAFGLGAQGTGLILKRVMPVGRWGRKFGSAPGMVVGSVLNQFVSKGIGSKFFKIAENNWHEWSLEKSGDLPNAAYGSTVQKLSEVKSQLIEARDELTYAPQGSPKAKELEAKVASLRAMELQHEQRVQQYRAKWFQAVQNTVRQSMTFQPDEFSSFMIGTGRMIVASVAVAEFNAIIQGLWAEAKLKAKKIYYMDGPNKDAYRAQAMKAMTDAEKQKYLLNIEKIERLKQFKADQIAEFRKRPKLQQMLNARSEAQFNTFRRFYIKALHDEIDKNVQGWSLSQVAYKKFLATQKFTPTMGEIEITTYMGRRLMLRALVPQLVMAAIQGAEFLLTDDVIRVISTGVYNGSGLQKRAERHFDQMSDAAYRSYTTNDQNAVPDFVKALGGYDELWDNYRMKAISGDSMQSVSGWDKEMEKKRHETDKMVQWLSFFKRSYDKYKTMNKLDVEDEIFKQNNLKFDPDEPPTPEQQQEMDSDMTGDDWWHTDPSETPLVFQEEAKKYMDIINKEKTLGPFDYNNKDPKYAEAYFERMGDFVESEVAKVKAVEYIKAQEMDRALRPQIFRQFFGEENLHWYISLGNWVTDNVWGGIRSLFSGSKNQTQQQFNRASSAARSSEWDLPKSHAQAFADEIFYLNSYCNKLMPQLLPTTLVLKTQVACRKQSEIFADPQSPDYLTTKAFDDVIKSKEFAATQMGMALDGSKATNSDLVAMWMVNGLNKEITNMIFLYKEEMKKFLGMPKSKEEDDRQQAERRQKAEAAASKASDDKDIAALKAEAQQARQGQQEEAAADSSSTDAQGDDSGATAANPLDDMRQ